jgi:hypothetical protein
MIPTLRNPVARISEILADHAKQFVSRVEFFHEHAGYSYDPQNETPEQGKLKTALLYAKAEDVALRAGYYYSWHVDPDITSADFSDELPPWKQWVCCMYKPDGTIVQSLGGIDLGRNGKPHSDPYKYVIEAELALEEFGNV